MERTAATQGFTVLEGPPRILINDLVAHRQRSGIGHYVAELMAGFSECRSNVVIDKLSDTIPGAIVRRVCTISSTLQPRGGNNRRLPCHSEQKSRSNFFTGRMRKLGISAIDMLLSFASQQKKWQAYHETNIFPLASSAPVISTFHDLSVYLLPELHPQERVDRHRRRLNHVAQHCQRFIAISSSTKWDMVHHLGLDPAKIDVIPLAPRSIFQPISRESCRSYLDQMDLPERYFLFLGTLEPRKNIRNLLLAHASLPADIRRSYPLVLVGGWGWRTEQFQSLLADAIAAKEARWLGYATDAETVALVNRAFALVYPSLYEGFGLPPLEAMACGTPVISSIAGALGETIGRAALRVDAESVPELAQAMLRFIHNKEERLWYSQQGFRHVKQFSWKITASKTLAVYASLLDSQDAKPVDKAA